MVNTTVWMPAPADEDRGVRGIDLFARSDADQLALLVALIDRGELSVDVDGRVPLTELPTLHAPAPPKVRCTARSSFSRQPPDAAVPLRAGVIPLNPGWLCCFPLGCEAVTGEKGSAEV